MPPLRTWYTPRDTIAHWARNSSLSGEWRWRAVPARANGQPALGFYAWDKTAGVHLPFALCVITLSGDLINDVTAFIVRSTESSEPSVYERFPEQPADPRRLHLVFDRFRLPAQIA